MTGPTTIANLQHRADRQRIDPLDRDVLLAHALGCSRSTLRAFPERKVTPAQRALAEDALARRVAGEPVAYITASREFWSLTLTVDEHTLIPRPDTETLVEVALALVPSDRPRHRSQSPARYEERIAVLDLGTGSGAIALALASERSQWDVLGTDIAPATLEVAAGNAARLGIGNVRWLAGDWWQAVTGQRFDLIVSNPPYIAEADPHLDWGDVRFEPIHALVAGHDGLDALRHIAAGAPAHLQPGGWLLCEHGSQQGQSVRALFARAGLQRVATHRDLAGHERVTVGRQPVSGGDADSTDGDTGGEGAEAVRDASGHAR
jgi:release factor glutamine methyltransferase